jgi:hypothetical protein
LTALNRSTIVTSTSLFEVSEGGSDAEGFSCHRRLRNYCRGADLIRPVERYTTDDEGNSADIWRTDNRHARPHHVGCKDAEKLQKLFAEVGTFMKEKNITDAVGIAKDAETAAADLAKAAKTNEADPMFNAQKAIQKQCKTCHDAHREQLPDKTFKLKVKQ